MTDQKVKPYLTIRNLALGYNYNDPRSWLFENLSLDLFPGELVCFMGPNGVGKSTLIRTLSGLHQAFKGSITFGEVVINQPVEHKISLVLTDRIAGGNLTVKELITYGRYPYLGWNIKLRKEDQLIIENAITTLKIEFLLSKKIYELSDGQMQLVMIARALAQDTAIMILDEPTAHLDLNNRVEIMNLLRDLAHKTHKSILVATHELDLALQTADTIWLAGKDKNIITGLPEDLVLNNSFDEVFSFKGFDLKTGKIQHQLYQHSTVQLKGDGPAYWWTKNALERNGYSVDYDKGNMLVEVSQIDSISWKITIDGAVFSVDSINEMLGALKNNNF